MGALLVGLIALPVVAYGEHEEAGPSVPNTQAAEMRAALYGSNEVPPTASTALGTWTGQLDEATGTISWTLSVPNIINATAAHLHLGGPTVSGAVVLPLFAAPSGTQVSSISASGTSRQSDLVGPLATDFPAFVTALKAGTIYVNVHTAQNPPGEIRGTVMMLVQAPVAPAGAAPTPASTGSGGFLEGADDSVLAGLAGVGMLAVVGGALFVFRSRRAMTP